MERTFKTPKGTELPITMLPQWKKDKKTGQFIQLEPKPYVTVLNRIVWFREEHPEWSITSVILNQGSDNILMKAYISNEQGRILSEGIKYEDKGTFIDYIEKCESSAIGRALAFLGFGTQYALELEEGEERLADAPATDKPKTIEEKAKQLIEISKEYYSGTQTVPIVGKKPSIMDLAKYTVTFGPNRGKQLQDIDPESLTHSIEKAKLWIGNNPRHQDLMSVVEFTDQATRYLNYSATSKSAEFNDPKKPLTNHAPEQST